DADAVMLTATVRRADGAAAQRTWFYDRRPGQAGRVQGRVAFGAGLVVQADAIEPDGEARPIGQGRTDAEGRFVIAAPRAVGLIRLTARPLPGVANPVHFKTDGMRESFVADFRPDAGARVMIDALTDLAAARTAGRIAAGEAPMAAWHESAALVAAHFGLPTKHLPITEPAGAIAMFDPSPAARRAFALTCFNAQAAALRLTPGALVAAYRRDVLTDPVVDGAASGVPVGGFGGFTDPLRLPLATTCAAALDGFRAPPERRFSWAPALQALAIDASPLFASEVQPWDAQAPQVQAGIAEGGNPYVRDAVILDVRVGDLGAGALLPDAPLPCGRVEVEAVGEARPVQFVQRARLRLDLSGCPEGPLSVPVEAFDGVGNLGAAHVDLTIDRTAPSIRLQAGDAVRRVGANWQMIDPDVRVWIEAGDLALASLWATYEGAELPIQLSDGRRFVKLTAEQVAGGWLAVHATDRAGNHTIARRFVMPPL
ncbi:MAG: hypothetical protein KC620_24485, partial [Myxococcales bacterium]|nr:hypothetical protein [Myxococcales bacterium]